MARSADRDGGGQDEVRRTAAPDTGAPAIRSRIPPVSPAVGGFTLADRAGDVALVESMLLDDASAAVTFVRRFQNAVFGLALSITRDTGMAEDVSQEAFVKAWRAAGSYDRRKGSVLTWLLTITRNAAIDAVRTRRPIAVDDELLDALLIGTLGGAPVEDQAVRRMESEVARQRLHQLPEEQARAVVLAFIGGCTAAEVSAREGIPLGTAKTRIRSGLLKLRAALEEEAVDG